MYIEIEIPEIKKFPNGFLGYWTKFVFIGSISSNPRVNALATTYVRLVEAALIEYRLAEAPLKEFWEESSSIKISAMHKSVAHFEACITNMHRAIRCFTWLRNNEMVPEGTSFTLYPDGFETPVEGEPGQTLKKIDLLKIGAMEIRFSELAEWLIEMGCYAEKISEYKPEP